MHLDLLMDNIWVVPKIMVPQNGWFTMENPIKMDDLGGPPLFLVQHPYLHIWSNHFRTKPPVPSWDFENLVI